MMPPLGSQGALQAGQIMIYGHPRLRTIALVPNLPESSRSVRMGEWLNVKDPAYGAVGDGIADDYHSHNRRLTYDGAIKHQH